MGIYKPLNYDATMLIRLTTEMKDAFFAGCKARRCEDTLEMFPAVPADEVENHLCDHHNDHQRERKEKTLVLLRYTIGK